ncbi:MAG: hypothetical protein LBT33_02540, partial [Spirochaetia bacterium]|nr:hypothetical protein [Spirochaetia bacterium]
MKKKKFYAPGPKKTKGPRPTRDIFDLVFKRLIRLSPRAVTGFINGLFGTSHPPDGAVEYPNTESVSRGLRRLLSDTVIAIGGSTYHVEVETSGDAEIAIRVFEYGFAQALRAKTASGSVISVRFPEARVIYLDPRGKAPGEVTLRLEFPGGSHDYKVKTFRLPEHGPGELEKRKMYLLLPFCVLGLRRALGKAKTPGQRKALAREMEALLGTLAGMAESGVRAGDLSGADGRAVLEYTERLYRELYMGYTEFKESDMIVKGMLLTYSEEVALKTRRKTRREDAKRYQEEKKKVIEETERKTEQKAALKTARKMKGLNLPVDQIAIV